MRRGNSFPLIGVGASAGGLEAFRQLISGVTLKDNLAIVFVQHLDPDHASMAVQIISKDSNMPVQEIWDGIPIKVNNIYVNPPNHSLKLQNGCLWLSERKIDGGRPSIIDSFFESLAKENGKNSIGILLSGSGDDGSKGLKTIHNAGGITCAQEPGSAKYPYMPKNAIKSKVVDFILEPKAMLDELLKWERHKKIVVIEPIVLKEIFSLLKAAGDIDFSDYKIATIGRRIHRRMTQKRIIDINDYVVMLKADKVELQSLNSDLLINVTSFFRDPNSYKILVEKIFPRIISQKNKNQVIRVWVPGCSSGEEAYSIAIVLLEFIKEKKLNNKIQIFATDISRDCIEEARAGTYRESISQSVSAERLKQFFTKSNQTFRVQKFLRDVCLFSVHDMTVDPPFSRLDLISCRNVLIYFSDSLQRRMIPAFHYALAPGGILWLGGSETTGRFTTLFSLVVRGEQFFLRSAIPTPARLRFPIASPVVVNVQSKPPESAPRSLQKSTDKFSLNRFAPPGVVVNGSLEVLEFRGKTSPFLLQPIGQPSTNLLKLINPEWLVVIKRIFNDVVKINRALKKEGLKLSSGKKSQRFDIEVVPINPLFDLNERIYLVSFISRPIIKKTVSRKDPPENQSRVRSLSRELTDLKNYQLDLSSQYEEAQEKLVTANELLQGINEELQSTNEEFETAKEELQSANEELITLNDELETRNFDLTVRSDDLDNLLDNTENPLLIVSKELLIRRFTPRAMLAFNLIATDVGRNIGDLKSNFGLNMSALIKDVMQNTKAKDIEVQGQDESWSRLQIRPYVTANNKVDGTIISLTDIEALKQKEKVTKDAYEYASSIAETVPLPLAVVDVKSHFKTMNRAFYEHFRLPKNAINQEIYSSLGIKSIQKIWLQKLFFVAIEQGIPFSDYEIASDVSHLGARKILVSGAKIHWKADESPALLLSFVDVTEQRTREEDRRQLLARERSARSEAEKANRTKDVFLATLSHELRTPLSSILAWAQLIRMDKIDAVKIKEGAAIIEQSAKAQSRLIDDLLDVSRISAGKITLELKEIDPLTPIKAAIESVRTQYEKNEISITTNFVKEKLLISGDSVRIQQIIWNLLTNAAKFSPSSGEVYVGLSHAQKQGQEYALIEVKDRGKGIPKEFLPHLFDRFSQADASSSRLHGGLGLGLSIVKSLVELHGGTVFVEDSQGECGAHFKILFPLLKADAAAEEVSQKIADSIVSQPRLDGIRILLVEDDIDSLQAISLLLQSLGAVVQEHSSAKHAVAALNQFRPDILVSDISMPEKDGFDLIRKIRALPHNEGGALPAIALTAHAALEDKSQTLEAGFQAHIAKPVEAEELGRVILNCLS